MTGVGADAPAGRSFITATFMSLNSGMFQCCLQAPQRVPCSSRGNKVKNVSSQLLGIIDPVPVYLPRLIGNS
jgi:hypothetical protein